MAIETTVAEVFSPDRKFKRLVLRANVTVGGDIVTPILNALNDKAAVISVFNYGANALTKVALIVSTDPSLANYDELAEGDLWAKSANLANLPVNGNGQAWIFSAPAAYFALYMEGDTSVDVVVDIEERHAV